MTRRTLFLMLASAIRPGTNYSPTIRRATTHYQQMTALQLYRLGYLQWSTLADILGIAEGC